MATTTHSESRAWEPDPGDDVDAALPATATSESTAEADQAALAAFAAAWSGTTVDEFSADHPSGESPIAEDRPQAVPRTAFPGIPGRGVIVLSSAAAVLVVLLDFALTGGLSMFFDLWFVVICLVGAMAVRRKDLFTAGVLAPLLFGSLIAVISLVAPTTFTDAGGFGTVFPTGLTEHAGALVAGYGVALLTVAGRLGARP